MAQGVEEGSTSTHLRKLLLQMREKDRHVLEVWTPPCQDRDPSQGLHLFPLPHTVPLLFRAGVSFFIIPVSVRAIPSLKNVTLVCVSFTKSQQKECTSPTLTSSCKAQSRPAPCLTLWAGAAAVAMKGRRRERERKDRKRNEVKGWARSSLLQLWGPSSYFLELSESVEMVYGRFNMRF